MRASWACPDLGAERAIGMELPVPGSTEAFPECPAAFLRGAADVDALRLRRGGSPYADHLIDGVTHPASIVSKAAYELKSGARNAETLSPKVLALAHLWLREADARDAYALQMRREARS